MGKLSIQFAPVEDAGTGEVDHALTQGGTVLADDVTNEATGEAEHVSGGSYVADAVTVESTGEHDTGDAVTTVADWPPHSEDKAVSDGESKATDDTPAAPAKKATAKKAPARKATAKNKEA